MLDLNRSFRLIKGALTDPQSTWRSYLPEAHDWRKTALLLTGPLIVLSALLGYLIGLLGSDASAFGLRPTLASTVFGLVSGAIAAAVVAFIVSRLSGMLGGKGSFALGLAATSLAFVPGYLGQALGWLPWIGGLIALALFVYALVLLWRIIPLYLEVPGNKRVAHYILSLIGTVVVMFLISMLFRPVVGPGIPDAGDFPATSDTNSAGGLFGGAMRQAELVAAAENDRYEPPEDGKLDDDQVEAFIAVMTRTEALLQDKTERVRELSEQADRDGELSIGDLGEMMTGATEMMGMNTVEIEVVKSAGGNWAEHQWVRNALRTAYVQKDGSEAIRHNYGLYERYANDLRRFTVR